MNSEPRPSNIEDGPVDEAQTLISGKEPENKETAHSATATQAAVLLFKGFIGAGVLSLPNALHRAGILSGAIILVAFALLFGYTALLLVRVKEEQERQGLHHGEEDITISDVAGKALGVWGERTTSFFLVLTQIGSCVAYVVFMVANLEAIDPDAPRAVLALLSGAVLLPLCFVRSMDRLFPLAFGGTLLFGIGVVAMIAALADAPSSSGTGLTVWSSDGIPAFVGTACFALVGINLVLPVENSMADRPRFGSALAATYAALVSVYFVFGVGFYAAFGAAVPAELTTALPPSFAGYAARTTLVFYIAATFVLNLFPVSELADEILHDTTGPLSALAHPYAVRTLLVALCTIVGAFVTDFGAFLSLVGYAGYGFQGLVLPGAVFLRTFPDAGTAERLGAWCILGAGVVLAAGGTVSTLLAME